MKPLRTFQITVTVDEERLKESRRESDLDDTFTTEQDIEAEMGWVEQSGIIIKYIKEIK